MSGGVRKGQRSKGERRIRNCQERKKSEGGRGHGGGTRKGQEKSEVKEKGKEETGSVRRGDQQEAEVIGMVRSQEVYGRVRTDQRGQQRVKRGQGSRGRVRRQKEVSGGSRDPGGGERS